MKNNNNTETFFCSRPSMASCLMAKGFTAEIVPNPFAPERKAWVFNRSAELDSAIAEYYSAGEDGEANA